MSDKHPNPHQQQAPVHDSEEAQPGLDSLAPDDREWRPTPKPTAPGVEPTAPGSLKAPDTHNSKLDSLEAQRKGGEDFPLTTNQGVRRAARGRRTPSVIFAASLPSFTLTKGFLTWWATTHRSSSSRTR